MEVSADRVRAFRLRRHHLVRRAPRARLVQVVSDVGAIHAQVMSAAELSLAARLSGLRPGDVADELWDRRTLVKTWAMRGTLHLVSSEELPLYTAALSTYRPWERAYWRKGFGLEEGDIEAMLEAIPEAIGSNQLTREELSTEVGRLLGARLGDRLRSGWGEFLKPVARLGLLCFGPNRGRNVTFVRPDRWLGTLPALDPDEAVRELLRRFLRAYGPAGHEDFARWFGSDPPAARRVVMSMRDELEEVELDGRRTWILEEDVAPLRRARPTSAIRLLPNFDVYVVGSHPRPLVTPEASADLVFRKGAWVSPVVAVGGAAVGVWEQRQRRDRIELTVTGFGKPSRDVRQGVREEADRLGSFLGLPVDVSFTG